MRRFSQKNHLVTLNEINITPLLDLAFVLLIIFIITTPNLEQSLQLTVPSGGATGSTVRKDQVRTIEVSRSGGYVMNNRPYSVPELEQALRAEFQSNPDLAIYVRADEAEQLKNVTAIMNICDRLNIRKFKIATRPEK